MLRREWDLHRSLVQQANLLSSETTATSGGIQVGTVVQQFGRTYCLLPDGKTRFLSLGWFGPTGLHRGLHLTPSALSVVGPASPSATSPFWLWNAATADAVCVRTRRQPDPG